MRPHVLVARMDNAGDVLLAGPAIRAVAAGARRVTLLAGPRGAEAAALLPGVDELRVWCAPWIDPAPAPVEPDETLAFVRLLSELDADQAIILTSFHQSPLPLALLLRLAAIDIIAAISEDYAGALLDVRHRISDDVHEVERNLSLAAALGYQLPRGDDGRLRIARKGAVARPLGETGYVVVHPGASVSARAWSAEQNAAAVDALAAEGYRVVVTGGPGEQALARQVAGDPRPGVTNVAGKLDFPSLAEVLAAAAVVVTGNTGPAHLAAAVGTPVVSLYAPTVPATRWHPWGVPHVILGDQDIACAGCRARECPIPGQPCLGGVSPRDVVNAVQTLVPPARHRIRLIMTR